MNVEIQAIEEGLSQEPPLSVQRRLLDTELTMMPEVAFRALKMAEDPDCRIDKLGQVVASDPKLSLDMLAMANSVAFGAPTATGNVCSALVRIGLRKCRQLIVTACYKSFMAKCTLKSTWVRNALWRHSLYCGSVCRLLDERIGLGLTDNSFSAGLMHDVGRLLLVTLEPDSYDSVDGLDFLERDVDPRVAEADAWGTDHCVLGGWFLKQSGLPSEIVAAALHHHDCCDHVAAGPLVALTSLADDITNHFQNRDSTEGYIAEESPALPGFSSQFGAERRQKLLNCVDEVMRQALTEMVQIVAGDSGGQ